MQRMQAAGMGATDKRECGGVRMFAPSKLRLLLDSQADIPTEYRLVNGKTPNEGRLEVSLDGKKW